MIKGGKKSPLPSFFLYHKSNYLRELGFHTEAVKVMEQLLERLPDRPDFLFHKANSLRSTGKHQEAIQAMDQALALDPANELFTEHRMLSLKLLNKAGQQNWI
nr:tetratricopeptide repeat protein [Planococcus glaciei]